MNAERELKRMVDSPDESAEVRAVLRAGIEDDVTDYDFKRGLAQHMAAVLIAPATVSVAKHAEVAKHVAQADVLWKSAATKTFVSKAVVAWVGGTVATGSVIAALWFGGAFTGASSEPPKQTPVVAATAPVIEHVAEGQPRADVSPVDAVMPRPAHDEEPSVASTGEDARAKAGGVASQGRRTVRRSAEAVQTEALPRRQAARVAIPSAAEAFGVEGAEATAKKAADAAMDARGATEAPSLTAPTSEVPTAEVPTAEELAAQAELARLEAERRAEAQRLEESRRQELLRLEMAQLMDAKSALGTQPARALALAQQGERQFPKSLFSEERQHVLLLALIELGRLDEARKLAEPYLQQYPSSPFARRVQNALREASVR